MDASWHSERDKHVNTQRDNNDCHVVRVGAIWAVQTLLQTLAHLTRNWRIAGEGTTSAKGSGKPRSGGGSVWHWEDRDDGYVHKVRR